MLGTSIQEDRPAIVAPSWGRMVRLTAGYAVLMALMLVSPLFVFLPAAIFHCTTRHGRRLAWVSFALAALVAGFVVFTGAHAPGISPADANLSIAYLVAFVIAVGLTGLAVAPMVERTESFGRILLAAVIFGVLGLAATELIMRAGFGFSPLAALVTAFRARVAEQLPVYEARLPADEMVLMRRWMDILVFIHPAAQLVEVAAVFVLSLVLFGRIRVWRDVIARRETSEPSAYQFRDLAFPDWLLFAFIAAGATPLLTGLPQRITANMLAVVFFLYMLQGLAVFRTFLAASRPGFTASLFAYLLAAMLCCFGVMSIAGLFDSFFDFRKFNRKDHSDESHPD